METLAAEVEEFLDAVALLSALDERSTALAEVARTLWARLARAEDMGCTNAVERIVQKLLLIGKLREEISTEIARTGSRESLQVLGKGPLVRQGTD